MSVIADPLALYGRLIDKGVDHTLARALSDALHETPSGLATEASVNELRDEMRQGFASVREGSVRTNVRIDALEVRLDTVNTSLKARIDGLETSVNARIDGLETSVNARIDGLERSVNARIDALPNALFLRLGSLMVVPAGVIVTVSRFWPLH